MRLHLHLTDLVGLGDDNSPAPDADTVASMHDAPPRRLLLATLACVAAAACWAANAVIAAGAFERGVSPERLAETRVLVALVPLLGFLLIARRDLLRAPRAAAPWIVGFGVCMVAVNYAYYVAIDRVAVGVAISLQYTAPVLILAATALLARSAPQRVTWVAGALTLAGAILVSGALASGGVALDAVGLVAGIASAITYAGYLVTAAAAGQRGSHPATTLVLGFAAATFAWAVILPFWTWPFHLLADVEVAWRVLAVGLLGTLIPFALTVWALRILSSAVSGIATTTEPVLAAVLAWIFLHQALTLQQLIGGGLVVAGVLVAQAVPAPRGASVPVGSTR